MIYDDGIKRPNKYLCPRFFSPNRFLLSKDRNVQLNALFTLFLFNETNSNAFSWLFSLTSTIRCTGIACFHLRYWTEEIPQGLVAVNEKLKWTKKTGPRVLILMLHVTTQFIICNGSRAWTVFWLASVAVNQNQACLKYRFYLQFPTSELYNLFSFNNDIIFQNSFAL